MLLGSLFYFIATLAASPFGCSSLVSLSLIGEVGVCSALCACLSVVFREIRNLAPTSRHFGKIIHGKGCGRVTGGWDLGNGFHLTDKHVCRGSG